MGRKEKQAYQDNFLGKDVLFLAENSKNKKYPLFLIVIKVGVTFLTKAPAFRIRSKMKARA